MSRAVLTESIELLETVLDRCSADGPSIPGLKSVHGFEGLAHVVLDRLCFVEYDAVPDYPV